MAFDWDIYNPSQMRGVSVSISNTSERVFKKIESRVEDAVKEAVRRRAAKMWRILRYRYAMFYGAVGRWPRYHDDKKKDGFHSFRRWKYEIRSEYNIRLYNDARAKDGFAYPLLLAKGPGPARKWPKKVWDNRKRVNSKGFSTQLPEGIMPFIKRHKALLKEEVKYLVKEAG